MLLDVESMQPIRKKAVEEGKKRKLKIVVEGKETVYFKIKGIIASSFKFVGLV